MTAGPSRKVVAKIVAWVSHRFRMGFAWAERHVCPVRHPGGGPQAPEPVKIIENAWDPRYPWDPRGSKHEQSLEKYCIFIIFKGPP